MRNSAPLVGLALGLALTGCGGAAKGAAAPTTSAKPAAKATAAETALAKAVKAYSADLVAGKGKTAYPMLSLRCRKVITASAFNALAAQAKATYPKAKINKLTVNDLKGTKAHVTYSYAATVLDQKKQSWVKEHGAWRWNGC